MNLMEAMNLMENRYAFNHSPVQESPRTKLTKKHTYLSCSFLKRNKSGMIGVMFPTTQIGRTVDMGNPIHIPTGIAPRNSTTGMAEIVARTAHLGSPNDMKYWAIF